MCKIGKNICALLLSLCMLIGILPLSVLATETDAQSQIVGQRLCLGDDLTMHFYAKISEEDAAAGVMNITVAGNSKDYPIKNLAKAEDGTYDFSVALSAPQMTEDITLTLRNGEETVLQKNYSIQDYAHYLLAGKYTIETKALVRQMLNYGAAAQVYFDYKTDDLANAGYEQTAAAITAEAHDISISGNVSGVSVYASTMALKSKVAMRYYFLLSNGTDGLTFTVNDNTYTPVPTKDGLYYIEAAGLNPKQMTEEMVIAVTDGTDTLSFSYNPLSYISRMYHKSTSGAALKNLLVAMNGYFTAAEKYDGLTDGDVSLKANSSHVYPLHETPYIHLQAQTKLTVSEVREGVYPRTGLRLTNEAGATVDFVLGYANNQTFWVDGFYVVTTDAQGNEATPEWVSLPEGTLSGDDDVILSVRKEFETTTLYIGDYQALQRKLAGFGADSAVTVSLYSRYTDTQFTDYSVQEIVIPDSSVNAGNHMFMMNSTPYDDMTAQTTLTVSKVMEGVYPRTGLRLTNESGMMLDYVVAYDNAQGLYVDGFYIVVTDAEGTESREWIALKEGTLTVAQNITLKVRKAENILHFYLNGTWVCEKSVEGFGSDNKVTAALYAKNAATDFSDYSALDVKTADSIQEDAIHQYTISATAYKNLVAQANLSVSNVKNGVYPRTGLRLVNQSGLTLDFVIAYDKDTTFWDYGFYVFTTDAEGKETSKWYTLPDMVMDDENVTLKVEKINGILNFYMGQTLVLTNTYTGFGINDPATAYLYSRHTDTRFADYSVEEIEVPDSGVNEGNHTFALNKSPYADMTAQTTLTVSEVMEGVYPRTGLRLTNESGMMLDYVVAYDNAQGLYVDGFYIVVTDAEGTESREWITLKEGTLTTAQNVILKVRKIENTLHFYLNGTWACKRDVAGFGADNQVVAALYSKNAATDFSDYSALDVKAADSIREDSAHAYAINDVAYESLTAQANLSVSGVRGNTSSRTGLRLVNESGLTLDFVIAYDATTSTVWDYGFYVFTTDAEGKETNKWYQPENLVINDKDVTLKVEKVGNQLRFYIGQALVLTNIYNGFGVNNKVTAKLYSRYADTSFRNYSVQELHPEDSNKESSYHAYTISSAASDNFTAQTELTVSEVLNGYYARAGLRLINANDQYLDFVLSYNTNTAFWSNGFYIVTWNDNGQEEKMWVDISDESILPDDDQVTMKIQLQDGALHFYIGETEIALPKEILNFDMDVAATVALYSKYATADFSNYSVN